MTRTSWLVCMSLLLCSATLSASASADDRNTQSYELDIDALPLMAAVKSLSDETGIEVLYFTDDAKGVTSTPVKGEFTPQEALETMLVSTNLEVVRLEQDGAVAIRLAKDQRGASDSKNLTPVPVLMAQNATSQTQTTTSSRSRDENESPASSQRLEEIIVTGTNIRGIAPESSPVQTFTREDIELTGAATAQDFIQLLPSNFGGGSNADIQGGLPNDESVQFNSGTRGSLGSSVNLRGLGSGATLVLLNGKRIAPSSGLGDFVDISMIPASAIERVEILTDGASSIYGADAVAGVVNFVLRNDFEGAEFSARYGVVTQGDLDEFRFTGTGGHAWASGQVLGVYEYFEQGALSAGDRDFSSTASLPNDLLPSQKRHSVLLSAEQRVSDATTIGADAFFTNRISESAATALGGDSFFASTESESISATGFLSWEIGGDWVTDFSGAWSKVDTSPSSTSSSVQLNNSRKNEATLWSIDTIASGSVFRVPAGAVRLAIGGQYRSEDFQSSNLALDRVERTADRDVFAVFGEVFIPIVGEDAGIPGVRRLEINASGRFEDFSDFGNSSNPKIGVLWEPLSDLRVRGTYSTSFNAPPLGRVGAVDLSASLVTTSFLNSVLGFTDFPPELADVNELIVIGTENDLGPETSRAFTIGADYSVEFGEYELSLSSTWFDIDFEDRLGATPIPDGRDPLDAPNIAFNNRDLFPEGAIRFFPTASELEQFYAELELPLVNPFGLDPNDIGIINSVLVVGNVAATAVTGVDFDVQLHREMGNAKLVSGVSGTYINAFDQQASTLLPPVSQLSTLYNPIDLRLRGQIGYSGPTLSANLFVNFANDYQISDDPMAERIESFTTLDLSVAYEFGNEGYDGILSGTTARVSVLNVFDENPPSAPLRPLFRIFGYDPTNASPLNRFIAFELTKRF